MSVQSTIETKITAALIPEHLDVVNESSMHNVPPGSESHFRVRIVSSAFEGQRLLERHRTLNKLLAEEIQGPVHALALEALTPEEWERSGHREAESPECLGGDAPS